MCVFSYAHRIILYCSCDFDLDPMALTYIFWRCACVPKMKFLGEGRTDRQTHTETNATECITSAAFAVGNSYSGRYIVLFIWLGTPHRPHPSLTAVHGCLAALTRDSCAAYGLVVYDCADVCWHGPHGRRTMTIDSIIISNAQWTRRIQ